MSDLTPILHSWLTKTRQLANCCSKYIILFIGTALELSPGTMGENRIFTLSQVAQHKSSKDCWLVVHGRVLNVTKFLEEHPGGEEVLLEVAGKDATKEFDAIGHSKGALNLLPKYQVGVLQGHTIQEPDTSKDDSYKQPKKKEMSAFVIKDDAGSKSKAFFEFFVPLLAATLYFGYKCFTRADQIAY